MDAVRWVARHAITFTVMQIIGWSVGFVVMPWTTKAGMG